MFFTKAASKQPMNMQSFLARCEPLTDSQRWACARELGRDRLADHRLVETIRSLARGNYYHQRLALIAADAGDEQELIQSSLCGASILLFGLACDIARLKLSDEQLIASFPRLAPERRYRLARALARVQRQHVVDRTLAGLPVNERAGLLCFASRSCVEQQLTEGLGEFLTTTDWRRVTRWHSDVALALAEAMLAPLEAHRGDPVDLPHLVRSRVQAVLSGLVHRNAGLGLRLLQRVSELTGVSAWRLQPYALRYPREIAELIIEDPHPANATLPIACARHLDAQQLTALVRKGAFEPALQLCQRVHPPMRAAVLAACDQRLREKDGQWQLASMPFLPLRQRQDEARHAIRLEALAARPQQYLPYMAYLPWDEAQQVATRYLSQPDGELRGLALAGLIGTARFDESKLDLVLALVVARRNEQDPVRLAMADALAELPPSRWQARHLSQLGEVVGAALSARDVSVATLQALQTLMLRILPFQIGFVCAQLPLLVEKTGAFGHFSFENRVNDAQMAQLAPHLVALITAWIKQSRHGAIFGLMKTFGRRLKMAPQVLLLLEKLTQDSRQTVATSALRMLLGLQIAGKNDPLIIDSLKRDEGWSTVPEVQTHLHRHRQDWLTRFLQPRRFTGRFSTGNSATFPRFSSGFQRWSDQQQETYAKTLLSLTNAKRSTWEMFFVMRVLAALPAIDITPLVGLASLERAQIDQRDKAVEMLGRVDGGRGVAALLAALDDERSRIAIYALRRALLDMPPDAALALLAQVPMQKITVAKEALRLAGELRSDAAYRFLADFSGRANLHVDVRIALLRAFWAFLERDEVWSFFATAVADGSPALARSTINIPQDGLSVRAQRRLSGHLASLVVHDDPLVSAETVTRLVEQPIGRADQQLVTALTGRLQALADSPSLEATTAALLSGLAPYDPDAFATQVLALHEPLRIKAVIAAFARQVNKHRALVQPAAERIVNGLWAQQRLFSCAAALAVLALPPETIVDFMTTLSRAGRCHPGVAERAGQVLPTALHERSRLERLEALLAEHADAGVRRLALTLLMTLATIMGWTAELQHRLERYRADADPWVHETAQLIALPPLPGA